MNEDTDYEGKKINPKTWRTILSFAANRRKSFIVIMGGGMLAGIIDTAMSFMSRWAIDGFMIPGSREHLGLFAFTAVGLQVLMAMLTLIYCRAAGRLEATLSADVRRAAYTRLQSMSFSYFDKTSTGHLITRLTGDISRITEMISWTCIDLGWGVMAVAASILAMFLVDLKLALITVTAVPVAMAPENTYKLPPSVTVVPVAVHGSNRNRFPPSDTVVPVAEPPEDTYILPPLNTVVPVAEPPEDTNSSQVSYTAVSEAV